MATQETATAQEKQRLTAELDAMRQHCELFLRRYVVLSWPERRAIGQGVVQFMNCMHTDETVKFFVSRTAFAAKLELYGVDVLLGMMPALRLKVGNHS